MNTAIFIILILITIKLLFMSEVLDQIKADLLAANEKVTKIAADVARLHAAIEALGDAPTAAELAEVKALSADLNTSLQIVDDATPE